MEVADWTPVLEVNLIGQFLCARRCSGLSRPIPVARFEGARQGDLHELRREVAPRGIRVDFIAPGAIRTPFDRSVWDADAAMKKLLERIPDGRIGEPDDVARMAVGLASDESEYVNGTTIFVDGGMCLYPGFADNG